MPFMEKPNEVDEKQPRVKRNESQRDFLFLPPNRLIKVICKPGVGLFSLSEGRKGNSGRLEHLSLEMTFVEIHSFRTAFVHVDDFRMIEAE